MNVIANNVAIGSEKGEMTLYTGKNRITNSGWASLVKTEKRSDPIKVEVITLDEYVEAHKINKIDMMKIDIEGAEFDALLGADNILKNFTPEIIMEINPFLLNRRKMNSIVITTLLVNYGYKIYRIFKKRFSSNRPQRRNHYLRKYFV